MRDIFITSSILILAILLIRTLVKGKINPCIQYALWLLVVIRLVLPMPLWNSRLSVMNLFPEINYEDMADVVNGVGTGNLADVSDGANVDNLASADSGSRENGLADIFNGIGADNIADAANRIDAGNLIDSVDGIGTNSVTASGDGITKDSITYSANGISKSSDASTEPNSAPSTLPETVKVIPISKSINNIALIKVFNLIYSLLPFIWIAGMIITGGYMLFYQIKWKRYLYANRKPFPEMEKYKDTLFIYTLDNIPSPCLSGCSIYLTKEMAQDKEELMHILAHEYCHYKQLDSLWVIVRCMLTIIYWFNPLVWVAAYISKLDSELSCDAAVIRMLGENERLAYGKTLIKLVSGDMHVFDRIGIASTMSGGEKRIKERIIIIAQKPKYLVTAAAAVAVVAAVLIAFTFSGAGHKNDDLIVIDEQTDETELSEAPDTKQEALNTAEEQKKLAAMEVELNAMGEEIKTKEAELETIETELKAQEAALMEAIDRLGYDEDIILTTRKDGIADIKNPNDYYMSYVNRGEDALDEGIYKLMEVKDEESSGIVIYGIYTKEFGCYGIKTLIGEDINTYPLKWKPALLSGIGENIIRVYEKAEDKEARTFAFKLPSVSNSALEVWDLYVCDRYDTGTISPYQFTKEDCLKQARERLSFKIEQSDNRVHVFDDGNEIGTINISNAMEIIDSALDTNDMEPKPSMLDTNAAPDEDMKKINEAVVDGGIIDWELGESEDEIRFLTSVGLKVEGMEQPWYMGLKLISFAVKVESGDYGERSFTLGKARVENYVNSKVQLISLGNYEENDTRAIGVSAAVGDIDFTSNEYDDTYQAILLDGKVVEPKEVTYINPCPSYSRISDEYGSRVHPATGATLMHSGTDFAAENGADVIAAADGIVAAAGYDSGSGNYVALFHLNGEFTYYTHCSKILVSKGDEVKAKEKIAEVGSTGRSTGPHLHFAVSRDGEYIKPVFK